MCFTVLATEAFKPDCVCARADAHRHAQIEYPESHMYVFSHPFSDLKKYSLNHSLTETFSPSHTHTRHTHTPHPLHKKTHTVHTHLKNHKHLSPYTPTHRSPCLFFSPRLVFLSLHTHKHIEVCSKAGTSQSSHFLLLPLVAKLRHAAEALKSWNEKDREHKKQRDCGKGR